MSIADEKYKGLIEDIYENGVWNTDSNVRTVYPDGSPAYTKSVFGKQVVFEEGEIPLLTSKFVGWRTAFKEMRLFWILQTVKKEDFEKENVKVWDEWFLEDNTLGKSYAYQFESRPKKDIVKVRTIKKSKPSSLSSVKSENKPLEPCYENNHEYIGKKFTSENYGEFIVIDVLPPDKNKNYSVHCKIQFAKTNYISYANIREVKTNLQIKDRFLRKVYGVGYLGEKFKDGEISLEEYNYLKNVWRNMLSRCYNEKDVNYKNYGNKGVFVEERWHNLHHFINDVKLLPQYFLAKEHKYKNWNLDKDYYDSNCYSKDTCVWLSMSDNLLYAKMQNPFVIIDENGNESVCISIVDTAYKYYLNKNYLTNHLSKNGKTNNIGKYKANYITNEDGYVYRYKLSSNQVVDLLHNIKNNPTSRRLMTSFWNDADVSDKALQECAMQTTWNVRDGKLDLLLYSRSVDTALGLPFNWIQYWLLLQVVAKSTGLKAGRFIHQMGNVHYYCRHENTLLEQINSDSHEQPTFEFTSDNTEFFDFTVDDIKVTNYKHNGKFSYEIAI